MKIFAPHATDSYKLGHPFMLRNEVSEMYSNLTFRNFKYFVHSTGALQKAVWFGGQGALKELYELWDDFFAMDEDKAIQRYKRRMDTHMGADKIPTDKLRALHKLGHLPLAVYTLDEGTLVKAGVPVLVIKNTDKEYAWLEMYLETALSALTWKQSVNATIVFELRKLVEQFAKKTGVQFGVTDFLLHDFSLRGMSGLEDGARSGVAHLTCSLGTDNVLALDYVEDYYFANADKEAIGFSVPATEHAVSSSNILYHVNFEGKSLQEAETSFMKRYITEIHPTGIVSYVSDTYDYWHVISNVLPELKNEIMGRDGRLVVRPDSGNPVDVLCGTLNSLEIGYYDTLEEAIDYSKDDVYDLVEQHQFTHDVIVSVDKKLYKLTYDISWGSERGGYTDSDYNYIDEIRLIKQEEIESLTVQQKGTVEALWDTFGGTITPEGYKQLDSHIGVIYGDSMNYKVVKEILTRLEAKGFSAGNVVFGVGSFTYNYSTRDTLGGAVKATHTVVEGQGYDLFKDPKGDSFKKSARGYLRVDKDENGDYTLVQGVTKEESLKGELKLRVFNGEWCNQQTLGGIRKNLENLYK